MAFLRSVARCNSVLLKQLPGGCGGVVGGGGGSVLSTKFGRTQFHYYVQLRRELSTNIGDKSRAGSSSVQTNSDGTQSPKDPLDVSFNSSVAAFKSKTTWELCRAYIVYIMCSSGYLVENNLKVMNKFERSYSYTYIGGVLVPKRKKKINNRLVMQHKLKHTYTYVYLLNQYI